MGSSPKKDACEGEAVCTKGVSAVLTILLSSTASGSRSDEDAEADKRCEVLARGADNCSKSERFGL